MFSLIVSSKDESILNSVLLPSLEPLHKYLLDKSLPKLQLIKVNGQSSLCKNYNEGIDKSKYKLKFFVHEDLDLMDRDVPVFIKVANLIEQFPDTGLVGLVGTTKNPMGFWWNCSKQSIVGEVICNNELWKWDVSQSYRSVNIVDGMFLATPTDIKFSEDIDGFHLYDSDYSNKIIAAGYDVKVLVHLTNHKALSKDLSEVNVDYYNKKWNLKEKCMNLIERIDLKQQHDAAFQEIIEHNQYRIVAEDLEGKNIIDIGANNGIFSLLAHSYNAKKIIAVESNEGSFSLLQKNTENIKSIVAINKAVTAIDNKRVKIGRDVNFSDHDGRCYIVHDDNGDVLTVSLHELLNNVDQCIPIVLKIDCEGSEYDILYGAKTSDLQKCSTILIEMHEGIGAAGKGKINELCACLQSIGYVQSWHDEYMKGVAEIFRFDLNKQISDKEVTVVISEFLRPELLVEQIEAFQAQTFKPKEIIIWQTQVKEHADLYTMAKEFANVRVIKTEHDFNLPSRFAIALLAKTPYVCVMDDDIFPAPGWLEECYNLSKRHNAIVCPYGVVYSSINQNDMTSIKYGEGDIHNEDAVFVDMGGHGWFGRKDWFSIFWKEPVIDEKIADDIHFAYMLKKHSDVKIVVSSYSESRKDVWANTRPDAGMGSKALHARNWDDKHIWQNVSSSGWGEQSIEYLKNNLNNFCSDREKVVRKYLEKAVIVNTQQRQQIKRSIQITCIISTKDRYFSTLPACLVAIANQTYKPCHLILLDDGEFRNIGQQEPIYQTIFYYLSINGISWQHDPGAKSGQVINHIRATELAKTDWIWRIDDDEVPECDVLEKLVANVKDDVGAVAGLVIPVHDEKPLPSIASNKIEDIYLGLNEQWFVHDSSAKPKEVDHLYSSFIYRKGVASYRSDLSPVCHREETMFTYEIKRNGYKNILEPSAKTWHFRNPRGGIRSHQDVNYFTHDERIFSAKLAEWNVKINDYSYVVLDNGIGDHFAFKYWLPQYFENNKGKKHVFFVCFPNVFDGVENITLASIADAKVLLGDLINKYNLYGWMSHNAWDKSLCWAYKKLYNLSGGEIKVVNGFKDGEGDTIIISPYSYSSTHAKSYPYWKELIPLLKTLKYKLVQIGKRGEEPLAKVDEYLWDLPFSELEKRIAACRCWISGDNFLQHMCNCMPVTVKGIVIWGVSNPKLFGYPYNFNILKDENYLRPDQFEHWPKVKRTDDAFDKADVMFNKIKLFLDKVK